MFLVFSSAFYFIKQPILYSSLTLTLRAVQSIRPSPLGFWNALQRRLKDSKCTIKAIMNVRPRWNLLFKSLQIKQSCITSLFALILLWVNNTGCFRVLKNSKRSFGFLYSNECIGNPDFVKYFFPALEFRPHWQGI